MNHLSLKREQTNNNMSSIKTIINSHPLAAYMILCFLLSWGSVIYCVGLDGFPARVLAGSREKLPLIVAATLSGPSISGLVLSLVKYGGKGTKQNLLDRYQWKRQYVLLALFAPSVVGLVLALMCSFLSSELYTPAIFGGGGRWWVCRVSKNKLK